MLLKFKVIFKFPSRKFKFYSIRLNWYEGPMEYGYNPISSISSTEKAFETAFITNISRRGNYYLPP